VLHLRMRKGSADTARGPSGSSTSPAGATAQLSLRADSGFWSATLIGACRRHRIRFSITVRQTQQVQAAIVAIDESAWAAIDSTDGGIAQAAETTLAGTRLIARRTRQVGAPRPPCGRTGATTPSSPTGPAAPSR
jgi:hypothetical protein